MLYRKPQTRGPGHPSHKAAGTAQQLMQTRAERSGSPNFGAIMPRQMDKLVAEGLFVKDINSEGGYKITSKGLARLKELEK